MRLGHCIPRGDTVAFYVRTCRPVQDFRLALNSRIISCRHMQDVKSRNLEMTSNSLSPTYVRIYSITARSLYIVTDLLFSCIPWKKGFLKILLSYDVESWSKITPCNKIDKPLVIYRFSGNVMSSITTLRT